MAGRIGLAAACLIDSRLLHGALPFISLSVVIP